MFSISFSFPTIIIALAVHYIIHYTFQIIGCFFSLNSLATHTLFGELVIFFLNLVIEHQSFQLQILGLLTIVYHGNYRHQFRIDSSNFFSVNCKTFRLKFWRVIISTFCFLANLKFLRKKVVETVRSGTGTTTPHSRFELLLSQLLILINHHHCYQFITTDLNIVIKSLKMINVNFNSITNPQNTN